MARYSTIKNPEEFLKGKEGLRIKIKHKSDNAYFDAVFAETVAGNYTFIWWSDKSKHSISCINAFLDPPFSIRKSDEKIFVEYSASMGGVQLIDDRIFSSIFPDDLKKIDKKQYELYRSLLK